MNAAHYPACKIVYEDSESIISFLKEHVNMDEINTYIAIHSALNVLQTIAFINWAGKKAFGPDFAHEFKLFLTHVTLFVIG